MRLKLFVAIAFILAAFLASGCSGSENSVAGSSLLHTGNLTWYEYRENHSGVADKYGVHDVVWHRYQFDNATYNGTVVPHLLWTTRFDGPHNLTYIIDNYFDPSGSNIVYSHVERLEDGTVVMSDNNYFANGSMTFWPNAYEVLYAVWANNFTAAGKETITIDGSVYDCDKYRQIVSTPGQTLLVWVATGIPVPVKIGEEDRDWSCELTGWG